jgi:16S rRNA (cytosine1402-N4)-methyltransferase
MVKKFMKTGNFAGEVQQDTYGNLLRPFLPLYKKPIMAAEAEIQKNRRARSARLRAAILLDG